VRFTFGPFAFDLGTRQLTGENGILHLTPKAFDLLEILVLERPNVVSKDVLQQRLWPDTFVAEANVSNLIAEIRHALDDSARSPEFVRTSHGTGYAFCGNALADTSAAGVPSGPPAAWLQWDRRRFSLGLGSHIIGRDADVDVQLEHTTVSRRHARILLTAERATLEDSGSKNGTFRANCRVTGPVALADGDLIGIGSLRLTFHLHAPSLPTETLAP
jgi:DNA-binding winged helix-turn-helix (wHTH) protein